MAVKKVLLLLLLPFVILVSCAKEELGGEGVTQPAGDKLALNVDEFPFQALSDYGFFKGPMAQQRPVPGVVPYEPINTLFTDYAHKFRFVWMPADVKATYTSDHELLDFPDGTVLIKTFYYDNVQPANARRIIETRLLFKRNGQWEFADYIWNDEQTEAVLDLDGSYTPITWIDDNGTQRSTNYRIPSEAECLTCHKASDVAVPIGPRPQNLNSDFSYRDGVQNQLARWTAEGYLSSTRPKKIRTVPNWKDANVSLQDRVRAYVDINCAHCHRENSHCDYRPMRFAFHETADPENLGVCVPPDDPLLPQHTHIVARGSVGRSLLHYRMASTDEAVRMPLLGRTLVDDQGLALMTAWISSLQPACP
jgi:uncharacterized repeat protein (TIGR03806 family)